MDDKMQILTMIEEGKITASEGASLLEALESDNNFEIIDENNSNENPKFLKIKVIEPNDKTKVNVKLPIGLISIGLKFAEKFSPEFKEAGLKEEDINELLAAIQEGEVGNIVEVDSEDGTKVDITIE